MNDQVVIGYLTAGQPEAAFMASITRLIGNPENRIIGDIQIVSGPKVDNGRNQLFRTWLDETTADYLFMVDDDHAVPPDAITRLRGHRKDIVGGLCFTVSRTGVLRPTIHVAEEKEDGSAQITILYDYPTDSLIQVTGTGAACMMVSRRCAREVGKAMGDHPLPWFAFGMHNGLEIGEDVGFCMRAAKVGFDSWVDTGLEVPHLKIASFGEVEYVRSLMQNNHPYYDLREQVPIYRELTNGNFSLSGDRSGSEGV
jgi:hypothetical protein